MWSKTQLRYASSHCADELVESSNHVAISEAIMSKVLLTINNIPLLLFLINALSPILWNETLHRVCRKHVWQENICCHNLFNLFIFNDDLS